MSVQFFAKGDGIADDSAAIQTAINSVKGGGGLYLPPGRYKLGSRLLVDGASNFHLFGSGPGLSVLVLTSAADYAVCLSGTNTNVTLAGFSIEGVSDGSLSQVGIGTDSATTPVCSGLYIANVKVSGLNAGIFISSNSAATHDRIRVVRCDATQILGTSSHHGYGIALGSCLRSSIDGCFLDQCQRHSVYVSVSDDVKVTNCTFYRHRDSVSNGSLSPALCIARSTNVIATGNHFVACYDCAISVEPHESDSGTISGHHRIENNIIHGTTTATGSGGRDFWCGIDGALVGPLVDVVFANNTIVRSTGQLAECVRICNGSQVNLYRNTFSSKIPYAAQFCCIYLAGTNPAADTEDVIISHNTFIGESSGGGVFYGVEVAPALCTGTNHVTLDTPSNYFRCTGGSGAKYAFDASVSNAHLVHD